MGSGWPACAPAPRLCGQWCVPAGWEEGRRVTRGSSPGPLAGPLPPLTRPLGCQTRWTQEQDQRACPQALTPALHGGALCPHLTHPSIADNMGMSPPSPRLPGRPTHHLLSGNRVTAPLAVTAARGGAGGSAADAQSVPCPRSAAGTAEGRPALQWAGASPRPEPGPTGSPGQGSASPTFPVSPFAAGTGCAPGPPTAALLSPEPALRLPFWVPRLPAASAAPPQGGLRGPCSPVLTVRPAGTAHRLDHRGYREPIPRLTHSPPPGASTAHSAPRCCLEEVVPQHRQKTRAATGPEDKALDHRGCRIGCASGSRIHLVCLRTSDGARRPDPSQQRLPLRVACGAGTRGDTAGPPRPGDGGRRGT